jgi:Peptidase family M23
MAFRLHWPTNSPHITQPFGVNLTGDPDFYKPLPGHEGIDFEAPDGAEIFACADGVISRIGLDGDTDMKKFPYGNQIRIKHVVSEGEFETVYAHLQKIREGLHVDDTVKAGDLIGFADHTGHVAPKSAKGAHLHLTLKKKGSSAHGETSFPRDIMDPTPFLEPFTASHAIRNGLQPAPADNQDVSSGAPPLPTGAFDSDHYRLQTVEDQYRRAWAWASGGSGNERWLNLIATPSAPYRSPDQPPATSVTKPIEDAIEYLKPDAAPNGTPRYWPASGATFCNIFVNDATRVLYCEIPNNPANTSVSQMFSWLENAGQEAGWRKGTNGQEAQGWVNSGHVAVMIRSKKGRSDHVALVRPGQEQASQGFFWPRIAQAGLIVSADLNSHDSFGKFNTSEIFFYLHD